MTKREKCAFKWALKDMIEDVVDIWNDIKWPMFYTSLYLVMAYIVKGFLDLFGAWEEPGLARLLIVFVPALVLFVTTWFRSTYEENLKTYDLMNTHEKGCGQDDLD